MVIFKYSLVYFMKMRKFHRQKYIYWFNVTANTFLTLFSYFTEKIVYFTAKIVDYSATLVITLHISHNETLRLIRINY